MQVLSRHAKIKEANITTEVDHPSLRVVGVIDPADNMQALGPELREEKDEESKETRHCRHPWCLLTSLEMELRHPPPAVKPKDNATTRRGRYIP